MLSPLRSSSNCSHSFAASSKEQTHVNMSGLRILVPVKRVIDYAVSLAILTLNHYKDSPAISTRATPNYNKHTTPRMTTY